MPSARSFLPAALARTTVLATAAVVSACAIHPRDVSRNPPVGRVITSEQINRSGADTMWEALRKTVTTHRFIESRGNPGGIRSDRGQGSLVLTEQPMVFLDGARLTEIGILQQMPATAIHQIRILNSSDGTTYFGTGATGGVILIETGVRNNTEEQPATKESQISGASVRYRVQNTATPQMEPGSANRAGTCDVVYVSTAAS